MHHVLVRQYEEHNLQPTAFKLAMGGLKFFRPFLSVQTGLATISRS